MCVIRKSRTHRRDGAARSGNADRYKPGRRSGRSTFLLLAVLLSLASQMATARAADPIPEAAALSEQGYEAYLRGEYARADELFSAAVDIDPHPVLRFNRGRALEELQRLPSALRLYRGVVEDAQSERVREAARNRATALVERLLNEGYDPSSVTDRTYRPPVAVRISLPVEEASIYINGHRASPRADGTLIVRGGEHQLFVSAEGYYPYRDVFQATEGSEIDVQLEERVALSSYVPPAPGRLSVFGPTAGMAIYLRGSRLDRLTPLSDYVLAEGEYDVTVRHPLYEDYTTRVVVRAGEETVLNVETEERDDLRRPRNGHQRAGNALLITSATLAAGAAGFGASALRWSRIYDDAPQRADRDDVYARARTQARVADGLIVSAVTLGAIGAVLRAIPQPPPDTSTEDYDDSLLRLEFPDDSPGTFRF